MRLDGTRLHHQHQEKAEHQESQGGDPVLDADDLVVGGKDVMAPEPRIFVVGIMGARMGGCVSG